MAVEDGDAWQMILFHFRLDVDLLPLAELLAAGTLSTMEIAHALKLSLVEVHSRKVRINDGIRTLRERIEAGRSFVRGAE